MVGNSSYVMCESFLLVHNWPVVKGAVRCLNCTWHSILSCLLPSGLHPKPLPQNTWTCTVWPHWLPCSSSWECVWAVSLSCYPSWNPTLTWRRGLCVLQTHGKAPKVIPPLLPSHQGKRLALNIGGRLLNAYICMILAKALEAVGVEVLDAETRAVETNTYPAIAQEKRDGDSSEDTALYTLTRYLSRLSLIGQLRLCKFQWGNMRLWLEESSSHTVESNRGRSLCAIEEPQTLDCFLFLSEY